MKEWKMQTEQFEYPITASVSLLDDGIHVLLTGGCRTHVWGDQQSGSRGGDADDSIPHPQGQSCQ